VQLPLGAFKMWIGKFKIKHECFILDKMGKGLQVLAHVLEVHEDQDSLYYTTFLNPIGDEEEVKKFVKEIKKDKEVIKIEEQGDQLITLTKTAKDKKHIASNFSKELFLVEPILHKEGYEYWHIGSWDRNKLVSFFEQNKKIGSIEMLKLKNEKNFNLFYPKIMPCLSNQQKKAFELALEFGYYEYPQKIHLEKLAKIMKISRMTYQEHLHKAERNLLPFFASTLNQ
jgi:predicted DNA binding protein